MYPRVMVIMIFFIENIGSDVTTVISFWKERSS